MVQAIASELARTDSKIVLMNDRDEARDAAAEKRSAQVWSVVKPALAQLATLLLALLAVRLLGVPLEQVLAFLGGLAP